jgi:hypothetical protein
MQDQTSCEYLLTGRWQRYEIDLPVIEQSPPIAGVSARCDVSCSGYFDIDDVDLHLLRTMAE